MKKSYCLAAAFSLLQPTTRALADSLNPENDSTAAVMALLAPEPDTRELTPSPWSFTPAAGLSLSQPKELNAWLATHTLNGDSVAGEITWAATLSLSSRYEISRALSLGLRIEYADIQSSRKVTFNSETLGMSNELSWLNSYVTIDLKTPVTERVSLGISAGAGMPIFYHLSLQESGSQNGAVTYGANPFSGFAGAFATLELSAHALLRLEAGYRLICAPEMTATTQGQDAWRGIGAGSVLGDSNGAAVPVDASAPYFDAGLTIRL